MKNVLWLKKVKHNLSAISLLPLTNETVGARIEINMYEKGAKIYKTKIQTIKWSIA